MDAHNESVRNYLNELSKVLKMRIFAGPYSWPPDQWDNPEVKLYGLNGFVAWEESGCHVYVWKFCRFFTSDIYSCKPFDVDEVVAYTKKFFDSADLVFTSP